MAKAARPGRKKEADAPRARAPQAREVYLMDELGRFVVGATAQGVPLSEPMAPKKPLELARALISSREIPPGTFLSKQEGEVHAVVYGGGEFFACAAQDAAAQRELPHELAAVVEAFEKAADPYIEAGGLPRLAIEAFPRVVVAALADPARFAPPPVGPLAYRVQFRASGARLALDVEVINATPWEASRVQVILNHDARALPLVSVKARTGGYARGVLTLPSVAARSRDRAVLLFEPRQAGTHMVEGELVLGLEGGGERRAKIRRARTTIGKTRVVPTVPKSLRDFQGLVEGKLRQSAQLELSEALGGLATVAGVGTEIEKDNLAKVLDWHGHGGAREVWYLGLGGGPERPLLVQVTQGPGGRAQVVVAAAKRADVLAYSALLRSRLELSSGSSGGAQGPITADERPEAVAPVLRAAFVARQISADLDTGELDTAIARPKTSALASASAAVTPGGGHSAGDEMVPGLIDALERSLAAERRARKA
jgi:hypothetical protein